MLGHDHHLAAPAGAPWTRTRAWRAKSDARNRSATSLRAAASQARVESWLPTRYSTLAPGRPARRRRASPIGAAAGPSRTLATRPRGAGDLEQVEDVAAEGEQHLARVPLEGVEQLAQLGRGREVVAGPGVGQVQVRDVDEPAAGLRRSSRSSGQGSRTTGWLITGKSTTGGRGTGGRLDRAGDGPIRKACPGRDR